MGTENVSNITAAQSLVQLEIAIQASKGLSTASSLSSSEAQAGAVAISSDNPVLPAASIAMQVDATFNRIILDMLDKWIADIQAQAKRLQEEILHPPIQSYLSQLSADQTTNLNAMSPLDKERAIITSPAYLEWLATLSPKQQSDLQITPQYQQQVGAIVGLNDYAQRVSNHDPDAMAALSYMATAVVLMTTFAGQPVTLENLGNQPGPSKVIFDVQNQALAALQIDQSTLITINLMLPLAAIYRPSTDLIEGPTGSEKDVSLTAATSYASNILKMTGGSEIDRWIRASLVGQTEKGRPLTDSEIERRIAVTKIIMLASPLALLYKIETGKITKQEFIDLVNNKIELPEGDIRNDLISALNTNLSLLSPTDRSAVLDSLGTYFDGNPALEDLIEPNLTLASVYTSIRSTSIAG